MFLEIQRCLKLSFYFFQVVLKVENGKGPILTKYESVKRNTLCDGRWHNIIGMAAICIKYIEKLVEGEKFKQKNIHQVQSCVL